MARRGIIGSIGSAAQRAAEWIQRVSARFRFGRQGGTEPGTEAQPGRERIQSSAELLSAAQAAGVQPVVSPVATYSERYLCVYMDPDTGETIARIPYTITYTEGTARSTRYSQARRATQRILASNRAGPYLDVPSDSLEYRHPVVTCRLIRGSRMALPTTQD